MTSASSIIRSNMEKPRIFLDSSVLFSGVLSPVGASRALLALAEANRVELIISMQVTVEIERVLARKAPEATPLYRQILRDAHILIVADPLTKEVMQNLDLIPHAADIPILLAAKNASVDYLVTLNTKHFLKSSHLPGFLDCKIGTPGDALIWIRKLLGNPKG